jgi:hypothetical protein
MLIVILKMSGPNCPRGAKFFNNNVEMIVKENVSTKHVKMTRHVDDQLQINKRS